MRRGASSCIANASGSAGRSSLLLTLAGASLMSTGRIRGALLVVALSLFASATVLLSAGGCLPIALVTMNANAMTPTSVIAPVVTRFSSLRRLARASTAARRSSGVISASRASPSA